MTRQEELDERTEAHGGAGDPQAARRRAARRRWHSVAEVARALEISEQTYSRWRNQYGGMKADDAKELRRLKDENVRLKRLVADLTLDNQMLKEVARGNL
jgi:cell division protein FtsB